MVESFMEGAGQEVPQVPTMPDEATRLLRARLIMEETLETIERGLGVTVRLDEVQPVHFCDLTFHPTGPGDMVELIDGCCDVAVVTTGTLSAAGVPDRPFTCEVNGNNLKKLSRQARDQHGKLLKPVGHKPPRIAEILDLFQEEDAV